MPAGKTALVFGATGLVGGHVLKYLCNDNRYCTIKVFVRSAAIAGNPAYEFCRKKINEEIIDFNNLSLYSSKITGDDLFCCVGTTIKKAGGSKDEFRKADFDIPVNMARIASQNNVTGFFVISSMGADARSRNFYLRTKGEMEIAVQQHRFSKLSFLRPSIILGARKELRIAESIIKGLTQLFGFAFIGRLRNYKPVHASVIAKAMVAIANLNETKLIYSSADLSAIGNNTLFIK